MGEHELCRQLADAAGALLLALREATDAPTGKALGAAGDRRSHELLAQRLAEERPADVVLSEEGADPAERAAAQRVWIVDPLDGTREYGEPPRADWAVHVAFWSGGELAAGAVALPSLGLTLATDNPPPTPNPPTRRTRVAVSRSRPPECVATLDAELVPMGSAGAKVAAVIRGEVDAYVHAGGQYEWDSAAPVAVARAAGLHCSRVDGSELVYNQPDPSLPDLLVCRRELAEGLLHSIN